MVNIIIIIFVLVSKVLLSINRYTTNTQMVRFTSIIGHLKRQKGYQNRQERLIFWLDLFFKVAYEKQFMERRNCIIRRRLSARNLKKGSPWSMNYLQLSLRQSMSWTNQMGVFVLDTCFLMMTKETSDFKTFSPLRLPLLEFTCQVTFNKNTVLSVAVMMIGTYTLCQVILTAIQ